MFGVPLHPLVVHFPVVLSILLPISVLVAMWAIRRGTTPRRSWAVPLAFAAALALSAFVATRTGENEEEAVERVVGESSLHEHEEAGERFLVLSGVLLLVAAGGLLPSTLGAAARVVTAVGAIGLVAAGVQTGHSGGKLVYQEGAASAYTKSGGAVASGGDGEGVTPAGRPRGDDDDER
ncbi:MAG TPA: transglutaminaseTgpA domain-containing protein [Gemmatimonadaceae bacterium]|nr:transglutaminaseTgpA domain-containing protein [Gemmatimonadaceae bacterium]